MLQTRKLGSVIIKVSERISIHNYEYLYTVTYITDSYFNNC